MAVDPQSHPVLSPAAPPDAPLPPGAAVEDDPHSPGRRRFVIASITVAVALTATAVSLIYWRWLHTSEPTSAIYVEGDESWAGARVIVNTPTGSEWTEELTAENQYKTHILLNPGSYTLTIMLDDRVVRRQNFDVKRLQGWRFDLTQMRRAAAGQPE